MVKHEEVLLKPHAKESGGGGLPSLLKHWALLGVCLLVEDLLVCRESTWYSFRTQILDAISLFIFGFQVGQAAGTLCCKRAGNHSSRALENEARQLWCRSSVPCSRWNPGPGIEPMSLALAGAFLTTGPQDSEVPSVVSWAWLEPMSTSCSELV